MSEDKPNLKELLIYITQIEDKRQISKIKHKLNDIVVITLFAMLANIEYWEDRYINRLYSTMLKIKVINNELNQKILFDKAKENYHSQNLGELELIYKQMKKVRNLESFKGE